MKASTMALVVVAATVGVPAVVIAFGVLGARGAEWAWGSGVRHRRVIAGLGGLYAVIGLLGLIGFERHFWGWVYLAMAAVMLLVAWWEGRKPSPS